MALDPSIALAVRAPQIDYSLIQSPVQQLGQVLTLKNLMQQQQLFPLELQAKQVGLKQALLNYQQNLNLANLFGGTDTTPAAAAPVTAPAAVAVPQAPQGTPGLTTGIPGLDLSLGSLMQSSPGAAAIAPPQGTPGLTTGIPGLDLSLGSQAATVQPATPIDISPPAAPSAPAGGAAAAPATAPPVPSGGIPGLPSWQRMVQVGGANAFPWIKSINEARTAQLDQEKKQLDNAKAQSEDMVRLSNGMTTNDFKNHLLVDAGNKGYISWDDVRKYSAMDVSDPRFQAQKESWGQQALTYDKSVELALKRSEEDRAQNKEVRDWIDFHDKQFTEKELPDFKAQVGTLTDASQFGPLLSTKSDRLKAMYGGLVGQPLDNIKIWTGAGKPGETVPKPTAVTQAEAAAAAAKTTAETGARIAAEDAPYQSLANAVRANQLPWDKVPEDAKPHVNRILQQQGAAPGGAGAASGGFTQFTTPLKDEESNSLLKFQDGLDAITKLQKELKGWGVIKSGPWIKTFQSDFPAVGAGMEAQMAMLKGTVGDLIKGGVLRKSDQDFYDKMLPDIEDDGWTARAKLAAVSDKLTSDLARYQENLRGMGRRLPGEAPPVAPAAPPGGSTPPPPANAPLWKSPVKITIGGPTVRMKAPGPNGVVKDIPADQVPFYKSKGATVVE